MQTQKYVTFCEKSEKKDPIKSYQVPEHSLKLENVSGSAKYKQSRTVWILVVL